MPDGDTFTASQLIKGVAEALNIPLRYSASVKIPAQQPGPDKKQTVTDLKYFEKICEGGKLLNALIEKQCREEIHLTGVKADVMTLIRQIELSVSELQVN